jgi:hypothetical protein
VGQRRLAPLSLSKRPRSAAPLVLHAVWEKGMRMLQAIYSFNASALE